MSLGVVGCQHMGCTQCRYVHFNQLSGTIPDLSALTKLYTLYAPLPPASICVHWVEAQRCAAMGVVGTCAAVQPPGPNHAGSAVRVWGAVFSGRECGHCRAADAPPARNPPGMPTNSRDGASRLPVTPDGLPLAVHPVGACGLLQDPAVAMMMGLACCLWAVHEPPRCLILPGDVY